VTAFEQALAAIDLVLKPNWQAFAEPPEAKAMRAVRGATHLFSEHGALEAVGALATEWFCLHLLCAAAIPDEYP
jgi:hypothetical protein